MHPATIPSTRRPDPATQRTHIVFNPVAGAGRVGREFEAILRALVAHVDGDLTIDITLAPGRAEMAARHAAQAGADLVIAVGGDGTVHEVANGLLPYRLGNACALGVIDGGTGSGFAESLGLPATVDAMAAVIRSGLTRRLDVGRVHCRPELGRAFPRRYVSECQVGVGAVICDRLGAAGKRLGGRVGYGLRSLLTGLGHRAVDTTVQIDDDAPLCAPLLGVTVANGSRTGGGMRLAPDAELDDGRLDVVLIHDVPVHLRPSFLAGLYAGRHVDSPYATICRARRVRVEAARELLVAADGEMLGTTPLTIEVEPAALRVCAPPQVGGAA